MQCRSCPLNPSSLRLQGEMYLEPTKLINSADFGLTYVTLLGGKMDRIPVLQTE